MTVEVTGYAFKDGELHLFATDVDERNREDDGSERELEFIFDKESLDYLYKWLHRQKAVKKATPQKLKEAVAATLGTICTISGKYLELA